jgi:biopolymer transport protein ExbB/TolQ
MDTYNILVIVLSVLLGIFLILSIVVVVAILRLVKSLKLIVAKGEQLVDAAEEIGSAFKKNAGAAALVKMLLSFVTSNIRKGKRK